MGKETVLSDLALIPGKANTLGFLWKTPDLTSAFRLIL